ncbi:antitermination protein Q [Pantoea sp. ICBG 1758]|uniref:antiterminator Q family protein n=1 Tax=Pantoea sp. ICBG 1758 TaxID=2071682 RepID=UPI000CE54C10|nr:antiterminator Q family protein [Pantoea sp. ICBG 1758]PPC64156.1 antitermination protein Q [Pantoea sp. ICBG 1758]
MRDMSLILERWAGWARLGNNNIGYSTIAAGFKSLVVNEAGKNLTCSDDEGLLIDSCMAKLKEKRPDEYQIIVEYYLFNISKRKIAKKLKCDEKLIRIKVSMGEGFLDGCLSWVDHGLNI